MTWPTSQPTDAQIDQFEAHYVDVAALALRRVTGYTGPARASETI